MSVKLFLLILILLQPLYAKKLKFKRTLPNYLKCEYYSTTNRIVKKT